jgi:hypothetical protein
MNKAQEALNRKMALLIEQVGTPLTPAERETMLINLSKVQSDSLWGVAIRQVFDAPDSDLNRKLVQSLVEQLASQAIDDPFTMSCVVGHKTMVLLLKSTVTS